MLTLHSESHGHPVGKRPLFSFIVTAFLLMLLIVAWPHAYNGVEGSPSRAPESETLQRSVNLYRLVLKQSPESNCGDTYQQAISGDHYALIESKEILIIAKKTIDWGDAISCCFRVSLGDARRIKAGDVFKLDQSNTCANVITRRNTSPKYANDSGDNKVWGGKGKMSGQITVKSISPNSVVLQFVNVVLKSATNTAIGTHTFNGVVQATLPARRSPSHRQ